MWNYINTRFSLRQGKQDPEFVKKPDIALKLVDKCLQRGEKAGVVLIDAKVSIVTVGRPRIS
jgi:DNA anti-recombination protein RmuC